MKLVASLGAKWQRKQKNLKSLDVLSACIRIRKYTCHSGDRKTRAFTDLVTGRKYSKLSSLVQSASIRIRKCICHSEDRQTLNNTTLTAASAQSNKKTRNTAMKQCESEQNDKTMVQYDETMVQYDKTKHSL